MITKEQEALLIALARRAGDAVMDVYNNPETMGVEYKGDDSPLTVADKKSHGIIASNLKEHFPHIPVISEEDENLLDWESRKDMNTFWLVDPLDGTKEFIKRTDDFTVNIALVEDGKPVWGVVFAPARDWLYHGGPGAGAWKQEKGYDRKSLPSVNVYARDEVVAVRSKSHSHPDEELVLAEYKVNDTVSIGSSLKFCLVAEGSADIYYRKGPTWEWDTAAAHAVVLGAGAEILEGDGSDGLTLDYNKKTLKNDYGFICKRK
jgi:3'(2'), 5'-bisphosphate nucleotidase